MAREAYQSLTLPMDFLSPEQRSYAWGFVVVLVLVASVALVVTAMSGVATSREVIQQQSLTAATRNCIALAYQRKTAYAMYRTEDGRVRYHVCFMACDAAQAAKPNEWIVTETPHGEFVHRDTPCASWVSVEFATHPAYQTIGNKVVQVDIIDPVSRPECQYHALSARHVLVENVTFTLASGQRVEAERLHMTGSIAFSLQALVQIANTRGAYEACYLSGPSLSSALALVRRACDN
jgi:hypothetical protein